MKSTFEHPTLGTIQISQSRRSRRISLSVRPPDIVRLSLPYGVALSEALSFVESKLDWVEAVRAKMAKKYAVEPLAMPFSTRSHRLMLNPSQVTKISIRVAHGEIVVTYPLDIHYTSEQVQSAIKKGICEALRVEAKEYLPQRTEQLARELSFKCSRVTVRDSRSRWGSCSSTNDISLSIHLMRLPDELIDYVIIHELCHTKVKDHSAKFHNLLDTVTAGRHAQLRKRLKEYNTRV